MQGAHQSEPENTSRILQFLADASFLASSKPVAQLCAKLPDVAKIVMNNKIIFFPMMLRNRSINSSTFIIGKSLFRVQIGRNRKS